MPPPRPNQPRGLPRPPPRPPPPPRRWVRWLLAGAVLAALLVLVPVVWLGLQLKNGLLERQLSQTLTEMLGRRVTIDSVSLGWSGGLLLDRIGVAGKRGEAPLFLLGQARAEFSYWKLLTGQTAIDAVRFLRPSIHLVRNADGSLNFGDVLERLSHQAPPLPKSLAVPLRAEDVPRIPLDEVVFEEIDLTLEDRAVHPPVTHRLQDLQVSIRVPGPQRPLVVDLDGRLAQARVTAHGDLYVAPLVGRVEFSVKDLTHKGLEPYLAKLPVKAGEPQLEASLEGWVDLGDKFLQVESGKPRVHLSALRYGGKLRISRLHAKLPGGDVWVKLAASLVTGSVRLEEGSLWLGDDRVLDVTGSLDGFDDPSFDLTVRSKRLALEKALAHVPRQFLPPEALAALDRIEPQGTLSAEVHALGTKAKPLVSGWVSATGLALVLPACTADLSVGRLTFTPDLWKLEGVEAKALGAVLRASADLRDPTALPAVSFSAQLETPQLDSTPLPFALPGATGRAVLKSTGQFATSKLAALNRCSDLRALSACRPIRGFELLTAWLAKAREEASRLQTLAREYPLERLVRGEPAVPPAERIRWKELETLQARADWPRTRARLAEQLAAALAAARNLLDARCQVEVGLHRLGFAHAGVPLSLAGNVTLDVSAGLAARDLRFMVGALPVGLDATLAKPLQAPELKASVALAPGTGTVDLQTLAALAPPAARAFLETWQVAGDARLGFNAAASLSATSQSVTAELFADGLAAGRAPRRLVVGPLRLNVSDEGVRVPRVRFEMGPAALAAEASLTREDGLRALVRTPDSTGVVLAAVAGLATTLPATVAQFLGDGRAGFELTAAGHPSGQTEVSLRLKARLPSGEASVIATAEDLLGAGRMDATARLTVPKLASVAALLPRTVTTALAALDLSAAAVEARVTARGDYKKLTLGGAFRFPGGDTRLEGEVESLFPFGRAWASLGTRIARLEELLARVPAARSLAETYKLVADLRLVLNLAHERGGKSIVEQTVELASARASVTTQGMTFPLDLSGTRGAVRAVLLPGQRPIVDADLSGLRLKTVVKDVPLTVTSEGGVHLSTGLAETQGLALRVEGDPVFVQAKLTDPYAERRVEATVFLERWQLGRWTERFIPKERSIVVTGTLNLGVKAEGRYPFLEGNGWVELLDVDVQAPQLRGMEAGLPRVRARILKDDILVDNCDVKFGSRQFHLPILGSLRQLLGVPNVYRADPAKAGQVLLDRVGGINGVKQLLGQKQLERLILEQTVKALVWVQARDYPGTFIFQNVLPPEDKALMWNQPQKVVDKHIELAKQALADKMGFPKRTYGDKNYRMIHIQRTKARVLDEQLNSIYPEFIPFWRLVLTPSEW